ncbi:hypothetical protein BH24CHL6_BH24CHL6_08590 [soil metagenome]
MLVVINATPVAANNWGSGVSNTKPQGGHECDDSQLSECIADSGIIHYVYFFNVENAQRLDTINRIDVVYQPVPGLAVQVQSAQTSATDVVVIDDNYSTSQFPGWTRCAYNATYGGSDPYRWCKHQYIFYNLDRTSFFSTQQRRRMIACHEFGHTLGLQHTGNGGTAQDSCMYSTANTSTTLRQHEINHLENDLY